MKLGQHLRADYNRIRESRSAMNDAMSNSPAPARRRTGIAATPQGHSTLFVHRSRRCPAS